MDTYDSALLDDRDYAPMDYDARRRAEEAMMARDRTTHRRDAGRLGAAFSEDGKDILFSSLLVSNL